MIRPDIDLILVGKCFTVVSGFYENCIVLLEEERHEGPDRPVRDLIVLFCYTAEENVFLNKHNPLDQRETKNINKVLLLIRYCIMTQAVFTFKVLNISS